MSGFILSSSSSSWSQPELLKTSCVKPSHESKSPQRYHQYLFWSSLLAHRSQHPHHSISAGGARFLFVSQAGSGSPPPVKSHVCMWKALSFTFSTPGREEDYEGGDVKDVVSVLCDSGRGWFRVRWGDFRVVVLSASVRSLVKSFGGSLSRSLIF